MKKKEFCFIGILIIISIIILSTFYSIITIMIPPTYEAPRYLNFELEDGPDNCTLASDNLITVINNDENSINISNFFFSLDYNNSIFWRLKINYTTSNFTFPLLKSKQSINLDLNTSFRKTLFPQNTILTLIITDTPTFSYHIFKGEVVVF